MNRGKIGIFLLIVLFNFSCGNFSEITVGNISGVTVKGIENNALVASVRIPVENPTMYKITVTELNSKVFINDQYLGKLIMADKIIFPSKSDDIYNVDMNIRLANLFGAALTMMNLRRGQRINIRLEGELTARSALMKRKIPINESREVII